MRRCRAVQTLSVGYDCVDVAAATRRGIAVSNTPAYCTDEVASHALTLVTAVARKLHEIIPRTKGAEWDYNFARPIRSFSGATLGIIGLGRIGRRVACDGERDRDEGDRLRPLPRGRRVRPRRSASGGTSLRTSSPNRTT